MTGILGVFTSPDGSSPLPRGQAHAGRQVGCMDDGTASRRETADWCAYTEAVHVDSDSRESARARASTPSCAVPSRPLTRVRYAVPRSATQLVATTHSHIRRLSRTVARL